MSDSLRRVGIAASAALIAGLAAGPAQSGGAITTSLLLPVQINSLVLPQSPCLPNGDTVAISGEVHVVSLLIPGNPVIPGNPIKLSVHFNMAGVDGTGASGNTYIGTGASKFEIPGNPVIPGNPIVPPPQITTFTLEHTDGCAATPLPLVFNLNLDESGHLMTNSTVSVGQLCNTDNVCN
jgi:hypothetical protein